MQITKQRVYDLALHSLVLHFQASGQFFQTKQVKIMMKVFLNWNRKILLSMLHLKTGGSIRKHTEIHRRCRSQDPKTVHHVLGVAIKLSHDLDINRTAENIIHMKISPGSMMIKVLEIKICLPFFKYCNNKATGQDGQLACACGLFYFVFSSFLFTLTVIMHTHTKMFTYSPRNILQGLLRSI